MKRFWNLSTENGETTIELMHEIVGADGYGNSIVTSNGFRRELMQAQGDLRVLINSPGGDVFAAADIYDALREYAQKRGKVHCHITGLAASAASVIAMAGDEVSIAPMGMMMIHNPWSGVMGNATELRDMADVLDDIREGLIYAYCRKTGRDAAEIRALLEKETWMGAEEALELGFVDRICDGGVRVAAMAVDGARIAGQLPALRMAAQTLRAQLRGTGDAGGGQGAAIADERTRIAAQLTLMSME